MTDTSKTSFDTLPVQLADAPQLESDFIVPGRPVVIKGGMKAWKALSRWTIPNLTTLLKDKEVLVRKYAIRQATGPPQGGMVPMKFPNFAETLLDTTDDFYLAQMSIRDHLPVLVDDVKQPSFVTLKEPTMGPNLWIGANHVEPLHNDALDGVLCQVKGKKRVLLYNSKDIDKMYMPRVLTGANALVHFSNVAPANVDPVVHPKFLKLDHPAYSAELDAGDMLYIPAGWCHHVSMVDPVCISVNYWYWPPVARLFGDWACFRTWLHICYYNGLPPHTSGVTGQRVVRSILLISAASALYLYSDSARALVDEGLSSLDTITATVTDTAHDLLDRAKALLPSQ